MFAIYGTSGRLFHGPYEAWRQVTPVFRSAKVRAIELPTEEADPTRVATELEARSQAVRSALHAYAQTEPATAARQPLRRVAEVMNRQAVVVPEATELGPALALLAQHGHAQAPVVDGQGRLVGMLSWSQLLHPADLGPPPSDAATWEALMHRPVAEVMRSPVPSVDPDTDIRRLALVLLDTGLAGLPVVVAEGVVLGFVSRSDILRAVTHDPPLDLWAR